MAKPVIELGIMHAYGRASEDGVDFAFDFGIGRVEPRCEVWPWASRRTRGHCTRAAGADRTQGSVWRTAHGYGPTGGQRALPRGGEARDAGSAGRLGTCTVIDGRLPWLCMGRASGEAGPDGAGVGRNAHVWTDVGVRYCAVWMVGAEQDLVGSAVEMDGRNGIGQRRQVGIGDWGLPWRRVPSARARESERAACCDCDCFGVLMRAARGDGMLRLRGVGA